MRLYSSDLSNEYYLVAEHDACEHVYTITITCTTHRAFELAVCLIISRLCTRGTSYQECIRRIFEQVGYTEGNATYRKE